jgi:hypothetical protein
MQIQNFDDIISGKCKPTCFSEAYAVMKKCVDEIQDPGASTARKEQAPIWLALYADPELRVLAFRLLAQHPLALRYCEDVEAQWS